MYAQEVPVTRDAEGRLLTSRHAVYDSHDRLAVEIVYGYGDSGVVETRTLRQYDRQGHLVREETYTADEYLIYTVDNKYDRQGRLVRTVQTDIDDNGVKSISRLEYRYLRDGTRETYLDGKRL